MSSVSARPALLAKVGWPLLALVLLLALAAWQVPGFLDVHVNEETGRMAGFPVSIAVNATKVILVATGMCLVIALGGIDLSVGATMAIAAATAAQSVVAGAPAGVAIALGIGVGALAGLWNGLLIAGFGIQPIVATLVLMVAGRGLAQLITGGQIPIFNAPGMVYLAEGLPLGVPFPLILALGVLGAAALLTRRTAVGLMIETIGDNPVAARRVGLPVRPIKFLAYTACGACAGLAGLLDAALIKAADANNSGLNMELNAIFAVVVGGTALTGGRFFLTGTLVGAVLLQAVTTVITAFEVPSTLIPLPMSVMIVVVILLQSDTARKMLADRLRRRGAAA